MGNKFFLIWKLVNLKYKEGGSIAEHLNEIHSIVNQFSSMKMVLDDELHALFLLSSLPGRWKTLVVSLSNFAPDGIVVMSLSNMKFIEWRDKKKVFGFFYTRGTYHRKLGEK